MKRKKIFCGIVIVLALTMVLCACEEEEEDEYGLLTINNLPSVPPVNRFGSQEYWDGCVYYDEDFKNWQDFNYWTRQINEVASFENPDGEESHTSPFSLRDERSRGKNRLQGFKDSGTFLVKISPAAQGSYIQYWAFMSVTFTNGKATIDYNDMTRESTLPGFPQYQ